MLTIDRLDHLVLTVADVDATVAFYTRVLGMTGVTFAGKRRALAFGTARARAVRSPRSTSATRTAT